MNIDSGENRFNDCVYETSNDNPATASVLTSYERTRTESVCPQVMRWRADRQVHTRIVREIACAVEISPSQVVAIVVTRQSFSKTRPSCNKSRTSASALRLLPPFVAPVGVGLQPCGYSPPSFSRSRSLPRPCWLSQRTARRSKSTRCASVVAELRSVSHFPAE